MEQPANLAADSSRNATRANNSRPNIRQVCLKRYNQIVGADEDSCWRSCTFRVPPRKRRAHSRGGEVAASVYTIQSQNSLHGLHMRGEKDRMTSSHHLKTASSLAVKRALYTLLCSFWYKGLSCVRANFPKSNVWEKDNRPISFSNSWWVRERLAMKSDRRADQAFLFLPEERYAGYGRFRPMGTNLIVLKR